MLGAHTRRRRTFTADDVNFLQAVASIVAAALGRARAEGEVREAATRLNEIGSHLREVLWITDPDFTRFEYVSPAYAQMWGQPIEALQTNPRSFLESVVDEDRPRVEASLPQLRTGTYDVEYRVRRPDGTVVWVRARGFPVRNQRGDVIRVVGHTEDVTARKRAELEREELLACEHAARTDAETARAQLATILERMTDAFFAVDREWRILHVNTAGEGVARDVFHMRGPVAGRVLWESSREALGSRLEKACRKAMEQQEPLETEEFVSSANAWFEVRAFPSEDGLAFFFRDITERRQTDDTLRLLAETSARLSESLDSEATLRSVARLVVPAMADFCVIDLVDPSGTFQRLAAHAQPAFAEAIEAARQFAPNAADDGLFVVRAFQTGEPQFQPVVTDEWLQAHVAISDEHYRHLRRVGIMSMMALPLLARGHALGVMSMVSTSRRYDQRDVPLASEVARRAALAVDNARLYAAAQHAQAASAEGARRLRFLADASRSLAESLDPEAILGTIAQLAVPAVADWCAVDLLRDDDSLARVAVQHRDADRIALANELRQRYPPRPDDPAGASRVVQTGRAEFVPLIPESLIDTAGRDSEHRRILHGLGLTSYICAPLVARGRMLGAITLVTEGGRVLTDDDLHLAEELARRAAIAIENGRLYDAAQSAVRARDDLLAVVSHDLRTPLGTIMMGAANQMLSGPADDPGRAVRQYAERIQRAAQQMSRLIDDLTDIGNIRAGRLSIRRAPELPESILSELVDTFGALAADRGTSLRYEAVGDLRPINCDRQRLVQALSNIVTNALNVTVQGAVTVRAEAAERTVVFSVRDTGPGIAEEDLPRVFNWQWRGEAGRYKGTGLGLAIAEGIAEAHGGPSGLRARRATAVRSLSNCRYNESPVLANCRQDRLTHRRRPKRRGAKRARPLECHDLPVLRSAASIRAGAGPFGLATSLTSSAGRLAPRPEMTPPLPLPDQPS